MMRARLITAGLLLATSAAATTLSAQAVEAKDTFEEFCRKCHGVRGTPPKTMKEKYSKIATFDGKFATEHSVDSIVKVLMKGKGDDMKSFKEKIKPADMQALAEYVHEMAKAKP